MDVGWACPPAVGDHGYGVGRHERDIIRASVAESVCSREAEASRKGLRRPCIALVVRLVDCRDTQKRYINMFPAEIYRKCI